MDLLINCFKILIVFYFFHYQFWACFGYQRDSDKLWNHITLGFLLVASWQWFHITLNKPVNNMNLGKPCNKCLAWRGWTGMRWSGSTMLRFWCVFGGLCSWNISLHRVNENERRKTCDYALTMGCKEKWLEKLHLLWNT